MNLLDRLNEIEVDRKGTLDPEDQTYCDKQHTLWVQAAEFLAEVKAKMEAIYATYDGAATESWDIDGYLSKYDDIAHMEKRLKEITERYIGKVVGHFTKRYNVQLKTDQVIRDLEGKSKNTGAILEAIYAQLGGRTFEETAVQQIKDGLAKKVWRAPSIKGNRLVLEQLVYADKHLNGTPYLSWDSQKDMMALLKALQHFEDGRKEIGFPLSLAAKVYNDSYYSDHFAKQELCGSKIEAIRVYKNGKVEVTFKTHELASQFVAGYTRKAA